MSDSDLGVCAWCTEPATDQLIIVPGKKNRKLAPVCAYHAQHFTEQGQMTVSLEMDIKAKNDIASSKRNRTRSWLR